MDRLHSTTSLHALEGIVEDRPTLETSDFAGSLTASGQHIIDEALVCAAEICTGAIGPPTGFSNHLSFHGPLRLFERRMLLTRHLSNLFIEILQPAIPLDRKGEEY